ncbi:MAG: dephospho-CoA kinase [Planctomycetota bacterium]|nr:MAG: dephospho-CoA kinase [Planctomycetota bacterium]
MSPPLRHPIVFGVLGGIASGKSRVARLLAGEGGVVLAADDLAQAALDSPTVQALLRQEFGASAVAPDGRTDRKVLSERIFGDPAARRRLEGWIHPVVRERIFAGLAEAREQRAERIVLDVPLLLENAAQHELVRECDHLVFVGAPAAERERRAVAERSWRPGEVARREATQLPLHEKRRRADIVIENDGTLEELEAKIHDVLEAVYRT